MNAEHDMTVHPPRNLAELGAMFKAASDRVAEVDEQVRERMRLELGPDTIVGRPELALSSEVVTAAALIIEQHLDEQLRYNATMLRRIRRMQAGNIVALLGALASFVLSLWSALSK